MENHSECYVIDICLMLTILHMLFFPRLPVNLEVSRKMLILILASVEYLPTWILAIDISNFVSSIIEALVLKLLP